MNDYYSEPNTPQLLIGRTLAEVPERLMLPFIRNCVVFSTLTLVHNKLIYQFNRESNREYRQFIGEKKINPSLKNDFEYFNEYENKRVKKTLIFHLKS